MTTIESTRVHLDYQVTGTGEPVICISGISLDKNVWQGVVPALADSNRVLTFDNRDVGLSTKVSTPYTIREMAEDTLQLTATLRMPRAHVIGHSMGGLIAQEMALIAPGRVRSLVLVDTVAGHDAYTEGVLELWKTFADRLDDPDEFSRGLLFFGVGRTLIKAAGVPALIEAFRSPNPQPRDAFKRQVDACLAADTADRLGRLRQPTLVVWGEEDLLFPPEHSRALLERLPNATGGPIPGAGHSPIVENPPAFSARVRDFLRSVE